MFCALLYCFEMTFLQLIRAAPAPPSGGFKCPWKKKEEQEDSGKSGGGVKNIINRLGGGGGAAAADGATENEVGPGWACQS